MLRFRVYVIPAGSCAFLLLGTLLVGCTCSPNAPGTQDATAEDSPVDATAFVNAFHINEIQAGFPIKAGMSLEEVDSAVKRQEELGRGKSYDDVYHLGWEKRDVRNGKGWLYFWVNGKHLLHCDLMIEHGRVKSVWVMPGNKEWVAYVYYRISGSGPHEVMALTARDPSKIESDKDLLSPKTPRSIDRLWLHGSEVTDKSLELLSRFQNLKKLEIHSAGITEAGLRHLSHVPMLRTLRLIGVEMTDKGLQLVLALKELTELSLRGNTRVTDEGFSSLASLTKLTVLELDNTLISDRGLQAVLKGAHLEDLGLQGCKNITDASVAPLSKMKGLRRLDLLESGMTSAGAAQVQKALPECYIVTP